jgi:hypothetical protein
MTTVAWKAPDGKKESSSESRSASAFADRGRASVVFWSLSPGASDVEVLSGVGV